MTHKSIKNRKPNKGGYNLLKELKADYENNKSAYIYELTQRNSEIKLANASRHLTELLKDGLVVLKEVRQNGRARKEFRLTEVGYEFAKTYMLNYDFEIQDQKDRPE